MPGVEVLYDEADKLKDEGKLDEAVAKLDELVEQDPDYALAHSALAVLHGKLGQHDKAVAHAERACALAPDDAFSYTALSVTYQRAYAGTNRNEFIQMAEEAMARSQMLQGGGSCR